MSESLDSSLARELAWDTSAPLGGWGRSSVRYYRNSSPRIIKARQQAEMPTVPVETIAKYTNEYLAVLGAEPVKKSQFDIPVDATDQELKKFLKTTLYETVHKPDLIWMKFTSDGFLGVVAAGKDVNFDIPSGEETNLKHRNTSGIIVHSLAKSWDRSFILAFPLFGIPADLQRGNIEAGIGNYLIRRSVPILDFYSHRCQFGLGKMQVS